MRTQSEQMKGGSRCHCGAPDGATQCLLLAHVSGSCRTDSNLGWPVVDGTQSMHASNTCISKQRFQPPAQACHISSLSFPMPHWSTWDALLLRDWPAGIYRRVDPELYLP